tara:strand:+ start:64 stop:519 length:456 start_codon:yes stop_codon:yes gene_type:complete
MKKIIIFIFLITISCSNNKVVKNHGIIALEKKSDQILLSKSNKNDVLDILGKPSTISLFDKNSWFYMESEKVNQSLFKLGKSKIQKNNILLISFNNYGIVDTKKIYTINDMKKLNIVKNTTVKKYDETSFAGKLLKSLDQKINAPKNKSDK